MTSPIQVWDDVLPDPDAYRGRALKQRFQTVHDGPVVFHGMAPCADPTIPIKIVLTYPDLMPTLSFFRQSPEGQEEPHYVHDDRSMGDWTAIYYLNPEPAEGDGTAFYCHLPTGRIAGETSAGTEEWKADAAAWFDLAQWERWNLVPAKFNRLVMFPAALFHARAIPENYGAGDESRLIQIVFGTGAWV
jgi:hypothetical protein